MNVSGPAVAAAWKAFLRDLPHDERERARLVVVHDQLESAVGVVKAKYGGSAGGHNGIKSCGVSLGTMAFARVGVGVGRPESRASGDVSGYVLRKMTELELRKICGAVEGVVEILVKMQE